MNITSTLFLFLFLPTVLLLFFIFRGRRMRTLLLLAASLFFYAWGDPRGIVILLLVILLNLLLVRLRDSRCGERGRYRLLILGVTSDVALLLYYKYLAFLFSFLPTGWASGLPAAPALMPLGISFYVFKVVSFQIDSYRKPALAQGGILDFALYVSFFPQVLSGPITRYEAMRTQIDSLRPTREQFDRGAERFALGFIKKILIAERLAALANNAYALISPGLPLAWIGALAYMMQLYFDFSGYSDMAIGLGLFFGIETPENFRYPYAADSVQDFWRRWHISLSTWFRDYVYFPLGGSRCSVARTCLNTAIVFGLTGLWHGANLTFVVWGVYHAIFLILERTVLKRALPKTPKLLRRVYVLLAALCGWVFFRADSLSLAWTYLGALFGASSGGWTQVVQQVTAEQLTALVLACVFAFPVWAEIRTRLLERSQRAYYGVVFLLFLIAVCYLVGNGFSPFLYIQF